MIVGIVGSGPCGLYVADLLSKNPSVDEIHIFESQATPGGRTRMGCFHNVNVVAGAGVVRARDKKLRSLASKYNITLNKFVTRINYQEHPKTTLRKWVRLLNENRAKFDRRRTFRQNVQDVFGRKGLDDFVLAAGLTDYLKADVIDTLNDYNFRDNTSGQTMFGIDWNALVAEMVNNLSSKVHMHMRSPVTKVQRTRSGMLSINNKRHVHALFWTGPKPSWKVLTPLAKGPLWSKILKGVQSQSFLRAYATPRDPKLASALYPITTYMGRRNPLQKIIPYKKGLYMVAYCDNQNANNTNQHIRDRKWLHKHSGVAWSKPQVYYYAHGTHYYTPLDSFWNNRKSFIKDAQQPAAGVYMCGEGLSQKQGWTEGALESAIQAVRMFENNQF